MFGCKGTGFSQINKKKALFIFVFRVVLFRVAIFFV